MRCLTSKRAQTLRKPLAIEFAREYTHGTLMLIVNVFTTIVIEIHCHSKKSCRVPETLSASKLPFLFTVYFTTRTFL